ncbi:MAG: P-II family nitrogen regulator, partial [Gemmatimonadaceae bacterium]
SDCRGFGQEKMRVAVQSSGAGATGERSGGIVDFTPKAKLEVVVAGRKHADAVVETIARAAHTGRRGDGKVFAWPLTRAVRIRSMETDREAIEASTRTAVRQEE